MDHLTITNSPGIYTASGTVTIIEISASHTVIAWLLHEAADDDGPVAGHVEEDNGWGTPCGTFHSWVIGFQALSTGGGSKAGD